MKKNKPNKILLIALLFTIQFFIWRNKVDATSYSTERTQKIIIDNQAAFTYDDQSIYSNQATLLFQENDFLLPQPFPDYHSFFEDTQKMTQHTSGTSQNSSLGTFEEENDCLTMILDKHLQKKDHSPVDFTKIQADLLAIRTKDEHLHSIFDSQVGKLLGSLSGKLLYGEKSM